MSPFTLLSLESLLVLVATSALELTKFFDFNRLDVGFMLFAASTLLSTLLRTAVVLPLFPTSRLFKTLLFDFTFRFSAFFIISLFVLRPLVLTILFAAFTFGTAIGFGTLSGSGAILGRNFLENIPLSAF